MICTNGSGNNLISPQNLVGRSRAESGGCSHLHIWVQCDLKTVQVKVSGYALGHTGGCHVPSNWKLEGSVDGTTFVALHTASNNRDITSGATKYFVVNDTGAFHRVFRLTCTGCDQTGASYSCFHICNFELYGDMKRTSL